MEPNASQEGGSSGQYSEIAKAVREGVHPDTLKGRMELFGDKMTGKVPLGADAKNKTARKVIGAGAKLLTVVRFGIFAAICLVFGGLFLWAGVSSGFDARTAGTGVVVLLLGIFCANRAYRSWQILRVISRA